MKLEVDSMYYIRVDIINVYPQCLQVYINKESFTGSIPVCFSWWCYYSVFSKVYVSVCLPASFMSPCTLKLNRWQDSLHDPETAPVPVGRCGPVKKSIKKWCMYPHNGCQYGAKSIFENSIIFFYQYLPYVWTHPNFMSLVIFLPFVHVLP